VAEAEIALASRDLSWQESTLLEARAVLERRGDRLNAAHAHLLLVRRRLLVGQLYEAEDALGELDPTPLPAAHRAAHELVACGIAARRLRARDARAALGRARIAASASGIAPLLAEVEKAERDLDSPAARLVSRHEERSLGLDEVETLLSSGVVVIDACRLTVRSAGTLVSLASRPVLFALVRALGEAFPGDVSREALVAQVFQAKRADESHRARLRVEIGRLRASLRPIAKLSATKLGFSLTPTADHRLVVLAPPVDDEHASVLALLSDGEAWSSSALALGLQVSQRKVQRALQTLAGFGRVQVVGKGRARLWTSTPTAGFTTPLLLPMPRPGE